MIVKPSVLEKCTTSRQLIWIGKKENNILKVKNVDLGFAVESTPEKLSLTNRVSDSSIVKLKCDALLLCFVIISP